MGALRFLARALLASAPLAQSDASLETGLALLKAGRALEAAEALESVAASRPSDPAVHYYLGNARLRAGDAERALAALEPSGALEPDNAAAQLSLGQAAGALGEFDRAGAALDRAVRLDPGRARPLVEKGRLALARDQLGEAVREFARAVEAQPADPDALRGLAEALFLTRDLEGARAASERGLEVAPLDRGLLACRSRVLCRLDGGEAAEQSYRAALEAGVEDAEVHFEAGAAALRNGALPTAVARLRLALERDPAHGGARFALARALARSGSEEGREGLARFRDEKPILDEIRRTSPRTAREAADGERRAFLALLYLCLDAGGKAREESDAAASAQRPAPAQILEAVRAAVEGRWAQAVPAFERLVASEPGHPFLRAGLAWALERGGRPEEARRQRSEYRRLLGEGIR